MQETEGLFSVEQVGSELNGDLVPEGERDGSSRGQGSEEALQGTSADLVSVEQTGEQFV